MPNSAPVKRKYFTKQKDFIEPTNLIEHQKNSFYKFIEEELQETFDEINPVEDYTGDKLELNFKGYEFSEPEMTEREARENNISYESSLHGQVELTNKVTGEVKEQKIYLGEYPWMTSRGTFIINGAERVIVSQLIRSSGVYFTSDFVGTRNYYGSKVIPGRGAWMEFSTAKNNAIYVKIDRKRKLPVTTLIRALGHATDTEIKSLFEHVNTGDIDYVEATLEKDASDTSADALIEVYKRLRPGDLATVENAKQLIEDTFFDFKRFDFSAVGRYKVNKRLDIDIPVTKENRVMRVEDLVKIIAEIIRLNNSQEPADDIDALSNRRVKLVGELMRRQFRIGLLRMERNAKDRMSMSDIESVTPSQLINARPIVAAVREFFASSQLSQFMDQINPLSELAHKRRLSSMGPGGLSRERAGLEVRDVHRTHYGRICVVETPEGNNIGLVLNLASFARINEYGFVETPYRNVINEVDVKDAEGEVARKDINDDDDKTIVKEGKKITKADIKKLKDADIEKAPIKARVTDEIVYLDAADEDRAIIAPAHIDVDEDGYFKSERVSARVFGKAGESDSNNVTHLDASHKQVIGTSAALIPFMESDRADRALTGSNQQRQAVPLIQPEAPLVGTGMERVVAQNSGQLITAEKKGTVEKASANEVIVKYSDGKKKSYEPLVYTRSNEGTSITQKVRVDSGDKVKKGDILIEGMSIDKGELALGRNVRMAFMAWGGYNYEDAVIVSERLVHEDAFTSVSIDDFVVDVRETKLGPEVVTQDIPNVSEESLRNLDENGVVRIGATVRPGDILVGKITPKGEQELSSEERLLRAIFGEKAKDVRDTSERMPNGKHGKVVGVKIFSKEEGHDLKAGTLMQIQVFVAQTRKLQVGDKMGGRHGNKGVIAKVLPVEDMPYSEDGEPVDVILNPLGVPSRMNIGQLFETHLGLVAKELGWHVASPAFQGLKRDEIADLLEEAGHESDGKVQLYDGRTGEAFDERTTIGYMYMIKLDHMATDKIHARATGPYAMVTQQPLGGKAQNGGQRFGEMEVWALEAYGVASVLQEMLTIKSDDVMGRSKAYESIVKGDPIEGPRVPESFRVLTKELEGLGMKVGLMEEEELIDADLILEDTAEDDTQSSEEDVPQEEVSVDMTESAHEDDFAALDHVEEKEEVASGKEDK